MRTWGLLVGVCAGFCWSAALAQDGGVAPEPDVAADFAEVGLEELLEVDVKAASKFEQRQQDAPSVVSALAQAQIRAYGWTSVNDILYRQPGFAPSRDYERRTVTSRGTFESWNNNHLLMLVDGVPFNDSIYGTAYTWDITPLAFVNTIEIIRGPGSALYGSNATNGVIQLNTISSKESGARASFRLGDFATRNLDTVATYAGERAGVVLSYSHHRTLGDEYRSTDGSGRTDDAGQLATFLTEDSRESHYFFAKVDANGLLEGLSLQFHHQAWEFETGHGWLWWIPDVAESMSESRQLVSARYARTGDRLSQEYVVQFQRHNINWNMRYSPNGAYEGYYPAGVTEYLDTHADELFARAQLDVRIWRDVHLLAGVENTLFLYSGDRAHYANAELANRDGGYPPTEGFQPLGPWFEWIQGNPVDNLGVYAQLVSGRWLDLLSLTLGLRYDNKFFQYTDITAADRPTRSKSFEQLSPRAALVVSPLDSLSIKLIAGRAFRAPAPSELFGANTFTLASNLAALKPEIVTTYELAVDWSPVTALRLRLNGYLKDYENLIAYSTSAGNLSTNIFSQRVTGMEAEVMYQYTFQSAGTLGGFANYSFVHLLSETIQDPTITAQTSLAWAPAHVANVGLRYEMGGLSATAQLHVQGEVNRRDSDRANPDYLSYRGDSVPGWATVDLKVRYGITHWLKVGAQVNNLLDTRGGLIKNNDYPFDYRIEGRRLFATVEAEL